MVLPPVCLGTAASLTAVAAVVIAGSSAGGSRCFRCSGARTNRRIRIHYKRLAQIQMSGQRFHFLSVKSKSHQPPNLRTFAIQRSC